MSVTIYDISPVSPDTGYSDAYVAFRDLGPRPECNGCDTLTQCEGCEQGSNIPVVQGDQIFFQFRREDGLNDDPENPVYGWRNGEDDYYISAAVESSTGEVLELDQQEIIIAKSVGWAKGSYQDLVIDSQKVQDWLSTIPTSAKCFRLQISTYRFEFEPFLVVGGIVVSTPVPPADSFWQTGTILALSDGTYIIKQLGGFQPYESDLDVIFSAKNNAYFKFEGGEWVSHELESERVLDTTCPTNWYEFVTCEQTVIIQGQHSTYDCMGFYYGDLYHDHYRIWATFEITGFRDDKTVNENEVVTFSKQFENWFLRLEKPIDTQQARVLHNSLNANTTYINNNEFINFSDMERNNETGLSWWSQITCERLLCEQDINCGSDAVINPIVICPPRSCPEVGEPVTVIGSQGEYEAEVACGETLVLPPAIVKDSEGNVIAELDPDEEFTCAGGGDPSGTGYVTDSEETQTVAVPCGTEVELEDETFNITVDGVLEDSFLVPLFSPVYDINIEI